MSELPPEGPERTVPRTAAVIPAAALPVAPQEDGADPDQYLWGV